MNNSNQPAFGIVMEPGTPDQYSCPGMTKRELAFFITLGGYLASYPPEQTPNPSCVKRVLEIVDAGFEALEKQPEPPKP